MGVDSQPKHYVTGLQDEDYVTGLQDEDYVECSISGCANLPNITCHICNNKKKNYLIQVMGMSDIEYDKVKGKFVHWL